MLETKALTVHPDNEQSTIDLVANFGWSLKSSQEIKNTDSHLENRNGTTYSVTTKEHYVKLILERDTKMENYDRIKQLENTYFSIMEREPEPEYIPISKGILIIGLLLYVIPGALYLAYKLKKRSDAKRAYQEAYAAWKIECERAMKAKAEARSLV